MYGAFYLQKTSSRSFIHEGPSINRSSLGGIQFIEGLQGVFNSQKIYRRPSINRRPVLLLEAFYPQKPYREPSICRIPVGGLLSMESLQEWSYTENTCKRLSIHRLSLEGEEKNLYLQQTHKKSCICRGPVGGLLSIEEPSKIFQTEKMCRKSSIHEDMEFFYSQN